MKILLIQPSQIIDGGKVYKAKKIMFPRLSMPVLASLTPPNFLVEILDEYFDPINFDHDADFVGLTAMSTQAPRAYQIADEFRKRGKKVIMGGSHASALPEEALAHVDSVVIGEAEGVWQKVLQDFLNGNLLKIYQSSVFPSLENLPIPRYDLLKKERYRLLNINFPIQVGRGCPNQCEFCSVNNFFGHRYRHRPIEEVVEEIKKINKKGIVIVDDNIIGNPNFAKSLFESFIPLNIRWAGQVSLNIAKDDELLDLAVRSGCALMFIGLETLSKKTFKDMRKTFFAPEEMSELIHKIQKRGVLIRASVVFGFDEDENDVFEKTVSYLVENKITYTDFNILTPLPSTRIHTQFEKENRIFDWDWSKYNFKNVVFHPKQMTKEELEEGFWKAARNFYSIPSIIKRNSFNNTQLRKKTRVFLSNYYYKSVVGKKKHTMEGH